MCFDDALVYALQYREDNPFPLAPALEDLSLFNVVFGPDDVNMAWLEEMVNSRWYSDEDLLTMAAPPRVARWKRASLSTDGLKLEFSERFKIWMKASKSRGLELTVC